MLRSLDELLRSSRIRIEKEKGMVRRVRAIPYVMEVDGWIEIEKV